MSEMKIKNNDQKKKKELQSLKFKYRESIEENSLYSNKMVFDPARKYLEDMKQAWGK